MRQEFESTIPADDPVRAEAQLGGWVTSFSDQILDIFAAVFDFVAIDTQHSSISETQAATLLDRLRHYEKPIVVRVAKNDRARIGRMLDCGADTIIVPLVESADQAREAVRSCFYPPYGERSYGAIRGDLRGKSPGELSAGVRCFVQIETELGMRNAEEIISTPGLSGVYVGPTDLSISHGLDPAKAFDSPQLQGHFAELRTLCDRYDVILGSHTLDEHSARLFTSWGADFVLAAHDSALIWSAARRAQAALRGTGSVDAGPVY